MYAINDWYLQLLWRQMLLWWYRKSRTVNYYWVPFFTPWPQQLFSFFLFFAPQCINFVPWFMVHPTQFAYCWLPLFFGLIVVVGASNEYWHVRLQDGPTKKAQEQSTGQKARINTFCTTSIGFPAAQLQASRSALHARIGHFETFVVLPFITRASLQSISGYYGAVWYKFQDNWVCAWWSWKNIYVSPILHRKEIYLSRFPRGWQLANALNNLGIYTRRNRKWRVGKKSRKGTKRVTGEQK